MRHITLFVLFVFNLHVLGASQGTPLSHTAIKTPPKLILFVVIDQFRGDLLSRFQSRFTSGGFRRVMERGAWFPQAQHQILQNMTGPGHATLFTGAYPYLTGIPINQWFDKKQGKQVYSTEAGAPKNLVGSTIGDELKNTFPKSRVVSLSIKDRAAILMGGHRADLALWLNGDDFQWTSSKHYGEDLPTWVKELNLTMKKNRDQMAPAFSHFPTPTKVAGNPPPLPTAMRWGDRAALATPAGLKLTEDLVMKALGSMRLGQSSAPDLLAVSLSTHDHVGHTFGVESDAIEKITVAEDALLSRLFTHLDKSLPRGMKDVLVVLSADHGVAPTPEWAVQRRFKAARVDEEAIKGKLERHLVDKFGSVDGGWIQAVVEFNFYFNEKAFEKKGAAKTEVERAAKNRLLEEPGIARAFTATDYHERQLPPGIFEKQILNSYFPGRSGDIVAIIEPFHISGDEPGNHQTGYAYDRTVPVILMGTNIRKGIYTTQAETVDIAPTIALLAGILPPSQSHGRILSEVLGN